MRRVVAELVSAAVIGVVGGLLLWGTFDPAAADELPAPGPTMAPAVPSSTTFAPVVPIVPTESIAAAVCDPTQLERERIRVARLRDTVARLRAARR